MNWNRIVVLLCCWLSVSFSIAQNPVILNRGKADSQECKDWVESRLSKMTLKEKIGQLFGGRKHTTVMHGCDNVDEDPETKKEAEAIYKSIV